MASPHPVIASEAIVAAMARAPGALIATATAIAPPALLITI
jgi:hypothetical protein